MDKRRFTRWQVDLHGFMWSKNSERPVKISIVDISNGGVGIKYDKSAYMQWGDYNVLIYLGAQPVKGEVNLVWIKDDKERVNTQKAGLFFSRIKDLDKRRLYDYLWGVHGDQVSNRWWNYSFEDKRG